ncbi:LppP/LprE family lipoprotein [Streptomyces sp. DH12]|uniref:LppP/LprE family lipoprotein n=1 Tax=Streptomyces sp. DH12 TaxID=2857010 RepID=UPI001E315F7B|nr:LppP/LprE family lipoprotein [Streptomyces sp. DH12]
MAGLAAVGLLGLLAAGCSTGGTGTRDEGAAPTEQGGPSGAAAPTPSASSPFERVDVVELLKNDPKVSDRVKKDLRPCGPDAYPVDTSYGNLTGTSAADVVVNVLTCGDAVGVGTYVYRKREQTFENVFALEEPAVYSAIDRGDLVVTKQTYAKGDPIAYPSGEEVVTYRWSSDRFTEHYVVRNEYSKAVEGGDISGPAPTGPDE